MDKPTNQSDPRVALATATSQMVSLRKRIDLMTADDALQVYSLAAAIDRIVGESTLGRIALVLSSTRVTIAANRELVLQKEAGDAKGN